MISVTNNVVYTGEHVQTNLNDTGIFQTVGEGAHYLPAGSPYRDAGTTNVHPDLLANLRKRTTSAPLVLTNPITTDTVLFPQAQRDTDTPDLGYHPAPLDFVVRDVTISNATVLLTNGVSVGVYGGSGSRGLFLVNGANLICQGSATDPCRILRANLVQEHANTNWSASSVGPSVETAPYTFSPPALDPLPTARFRFTHWAMPAGGGDHFYGGFEDLPTVVFQDCQFWSGRLYSDYPAVAFTNCLLHRVDATLCAESGDYRNNLFYGGKLTVDAMFAPHRFWDNFFHDTELNQNGCPVTNSYNGYITNANRLSPNSSNDVVLSAEPVYETGPLARFYYPTNDGLLSLLIDSGSSSATNAGLYHFATTTNNVIEDSSIIDIGYHVVALINGVPFDWDGDGLADHHEDWDGNGTYEPGSETDWQTYDSLYGVGSGPGLQVFTPLKP